MKQKLARKEIEGLIPHRAPMLLVDRVLGWEKDGWLEAEVLFGADSMFFGGHFPGMPLLPGVVMVEALAQAAACLTSLSKGAGAAEVVYLFSAIEEVRFKAPLRPGETLQMRVEKTFEKLGMLGFKTEGRINGVVAVMATFTAKMQRK